MNKQRNDYFLQRGFSAELRATGSDTAKTGHIVEGLAAVYDKETVIRDMFGEFTEVIREGAFDETDFDDVMFLVNHDFKGIPLARSRRNNKSDKPNTMKLWVDAKGINISADLDTANNSRAQELYSAIDRGDMDGMSFCFYVREDGLKWNEDFTRREIFKVEKVIEVSAVNLPAYNATTIDSRSLDSDRRALENAGAKALENATQEEAKETKPVDYRLKAILNIYKK